MPLPPIGQEEPPLRVIPGGLTADDAYDDGDDRNVGGYGYDVDDEPYARRRSPARPYLHDEDEQDDGPPPRKRRSAASRVALKAVVVLALMVGAAALYLASRDVVGTPAVADTVASAAPAAPLPAAMPAPVPAPVAAVPRPPVPSVPALVILIRNTLVALQQANETGNYSVLREMATPDLQAVTSTAVLADVFASLREREVDLAAVTVVDPMLNRPPVVDTKGMLLLDGYFDAAGTKVEFDLAFQLVDGRWRLSILGVQPEDTAGKPADAGGRVPSEKPEVPDAATIVALMRTTVIALNQANMTGNYSVLRDLGAPGFQEANTFAKLAAIFADLRGRQLDLGPVAVIDPKLFKPASIDSRGMLRLTGFFTSQPEQVNFDLAFQRVDGRWKLFGLGVNTTREAPAPVAAAPSSAGEPAAQDPEEHAAVPQPKAKPMGTPPLPRLRPVAPQEQG